VVVREPTIAVMTTAYVLAKNLHTQTVQEDELRFSQFRIWRVDPGNVDDAKELLSGGDVYMDSWVYERKYGEVPVVRNNSARADSHQ
jgi:hypothetical protein